MKKSINEIIRKTIIIENNLNNKYKKNINENILYSGKSIINVDIQPEYEKYITFNLYNWAKYINKLSNKNDIIFLYNGSDTLGMIDKNSYIEWLYYLGIKENVLYKSQFYDKGYAFFRYCIDNSIDENNIIDLVKYMIKHNINDSRDIDEEMWDNFMIETNHNKGEIRELLEYADDMINIPDLMDYLKNKQNIILMGGGVHECLKEVEIALLSLNKNYNILNNYTY